MDVYFAQAATQGQTLLNSSGDDGAAECDYTESSAAHGLVASWPATSPNFTGVGGTEFNADGTPANPQTGADAYWTYSSTADIISSAIQYIPETSWNDTAYNQSLKSTNGLSATGGGVSLIYPAQTWQPTPSGFTGTSMRFSPDISFTASPDHDGYLVCTQNFTGTTVASSTGSTCTDGFRYGSATGNLTVYGGTSCSSPSFAGLLTLIVQAGGKLGAVNSKLYALAANSSSYASIFHDVTTGNNIVPCTAGAAGNTINGVNDCTTGSMGYSATTGYDLVTGLGSANGMNLYSALTNALSASSTALQLSGSSVNLNGSINLTATVSSTSSGTPTGTVTFYVGSTSLGTATLNGSDTATLSNVAVTVANGFSAGTDSLTAIYSGDTTFATSTSTAQTLTVNGLTTTVTPVASTNPVAIGQSETLTATLGTTAATGSVTFRIGSVTLGTGTVSNGVATLTLAASVANGFTVPSVTITATYNGDSSYSPVTNTMALTATITPIYAGTVTGTVWFYVGSTSVGRTTPSSNTATLILNATAANSFALGANSITATYSGDTNYTGSNSLASTLTLTATTTTAVTVGSSSIALGSSTATQSFTATVTSIRGRYSHRHGHLQRGRHQSEPGHAVGRHGHSEQHRAHHGQRLYRRHGHGHGHVHARHGQLLQLQQQHQHLHRHGAGLHHHPGFLLGHVDPRQFDHRGRDADLIRLCRQHQLDGHTQLRTDHGLAFFGHRDAHGQRPGLHQPEHWCQQFGHQPSSAPAVDDWWRCLCRHAGRAASAPPP